MTLKIKMTLLIYNLCSKSGLNGGFTFHPQTFTVDTKKAGKGGLGLAIEGPSEAKMTCRDNRDGTCGVEFLPVKRGIYDIAIKFAEQSIPGLTIIRSIWFLSISVAFLLESL